ncbi:MAG: hypothetical protein KGJ51_13000 [Acidobacteriota bacterium]|nr:hypothetical protein [Acidobacteriota bacterium]
MRIWSAVAVLLCGAGMAMAQTMPQTAGETLSGQRVTLAQAVRGQRVVLVAGFSRAGGEGTGAWVKAVQTDPALKGVAVWQVAMLAGVPGIFRGAIRNGMKKGLTAAEQERFVVLAEDEAAWRSYFGVTEDSEPT